MDDAFLARYGNQDIHTLRGVSRLSRADKKIFAACIQRHIAIEVGPRKDDEED